MQVVNSTILNNRRFNWFGYLLLVLFLLPFFASAQQATPLLQRKITLKLTNVLLDEALDKVAESGAFHFSYNPATLPQDKRVSLSGATQTVQSILIAWLGENYSYIETGNYLIIRAEKPKAAAPAQANKPKSKAKETAKERTEYTVFGYIREQGTNLPIANASVLAVDASKATLTNDSGYYSLTVSVDDNLSLGYLKSNYRDTLIILQPSANQQVDIALMPRKVEHIDKLQIKAVDPDAFAAKRPDEMALVKDLVRSEMQLQALNIGAYKSKSFQVSLLPWMGSNGLLSGTYTNKFSLNLVAGYAGGLNGVEFGGFLNIVRGNAKYAQFAGFMNIVGHDFKGGQFAGGINYVGGHFVGMQAAAISNISIDTLRGWQTASVSNYAHRTINGVQSAGLMNFCMSEVNGIQLAGLFNFSKRVSGLQAAGLMNIASKRADVCQMASLINITHSLHGLQLSALLNIAKKNNGLQLGILNISKQNNGIQFGIINFSDTSRGVPIGLINFVTKGYNRFEISANEVQPFNVALKMGAQHFYNIYHVGFRTHPIYQYNTVGFGIGSQWSLGNRFTWSTDLLGKWMFDKAFKPYTNSYLFTLSTGLGVRFGKEGELAIGPSINWQQLPGNPDSSSKTPLLWDNSISTPALANLADFSWFGFFVAIRI